MNINLDTFIISDTHFGHNNIVKYCDRPENHDEIMFDKWLGAVSIDDTVLHLGDLTFKNKDFMNIGILPGKKFLIKGNHDHKKDSFYNDLGFTIVEDGISFQQGPRKIIFSHYPVKDRERYWDINIHGHIHNNGYVTLEDNGRRFINVSVEVMDYTPTKLRDILKEV